MSGVYLIVWDDDNQELLHTTKGGYPHITIAYTGKLLEKAKLVEIANKAMREMVMNTVTLSNVFVNSFEDKHGNMRHDVSLQVKSDGMVEEFRQRELDVLENSSKFYMRDLHVTHSIHTDRASAEKVAKRVSKLLPYNVTITGTTID